MTLQLSENPEFDNHEMVTVLHDADTGLLGYIAVHTTRPGRAVGGTRLLPYNTEAEALADVLRLSRAMSYKCALAGLPYGGAKAVIIAPPQAKTPKLMRAYARMVENLGGLFRTGTDVGISDADVQIMASASQYLIGAKALEDPSLPTTSQMAAQGVFYAIEAALEYATGNATLEGRTIAVKGLGKLGGHLAKLLHAAGARLVVGDVDPLQVDAIQAAIPSVKVVPADQIHAESVDVYAPCALGADITMETAAELQTHIVAGGANNQLASAKVGQELHRRGIVFVPDYVANAGGLIHVTAELEPGGYSTATVDRRIRHIAKTVRQVLQAADEQNRSSDAVAQALATSLIH